MMVIFLKYTIRSDAPFSYLFARLYGRAKRETERRGLRHRYDLARVDRLV